MKTWKTVVMSVITTASLVTIGATTYNYLKPSHYEGDIFTNVSTTISNTSSSTSVSSSNESIEDTNSYTNSNTVYTESSNTEQVTNEDPYNLINTYIDDIHKVVEYYNGYYIVDEPVETGYGTKYMYIVYNPETGELAPNGSNMIQEQLNWIDNFGELN